MIHSLWRRKWLALVKISAYVPTHSRCVMSLRYMSTMISPQDNSRESSIGISSPKSGPVSEFLPSESSEKSKLVLEFLKDCGFSEPEIKLVVSRRPQILVSDPKKSLKPKVDFLLSKGISIPHCVRIVSMEPKVLTCSLEKYLIPLFDFLESVVGENATRAVRNYPYIFRSNIRRSIELNTKMLQNTGVPDSQIAKLIVNCLRAIVPHPSRFEEAITMAKEMGFKPTDSTFGNAVAAIGWCNKVAWKNKMDLWRSYGLSNAEIAFGFRKQPLIMMLKSENIMAKMEFFVKHMHWCPHRVITTPHILMQSLEKRIISRLSVLHILMQQGEVRKEEITSVQNFLMIPEKIFTQKYITNYQDRVPEVLNAHQGKLTIVDRHALVINTAFKKNEYLSGT